MEASASPRRDFMWNLCPWGTQGPQHRNLPLSDSLSSLANMHPARTGLTFLLAQKQLYSGILRMSQEKDCKDRTPNLSFLTGKMGTLTLTTASITPVPRNLPSSFGLHRSQSPPPRTHTQFTHVYAGKPPKHIKIIIIKTQIMTYST